MVMVMVMIFVLHRGAEAVGGLLHNGLAPFLYHFERPGREALRDAVCIGDFDEDLLFQVCCVHVTQEELLVGLHDGGHRTCWLVREFNAIMPYPSHQELFVEKSCSALRLRVEQSVPATLVCENQVILAQVVSKMDRMLLAGLAAILLARAVGQKAAEHAVLRVKDGQVVVKNDFHVSRGPKSLCEPHDLIRIEIMSGCEPREVAIRLCHGFRSVAVRNVE